MRNGSVFISHATSDDAFVSELRHALEGLHIPVWVDSRNLRGGDVLAPDIAQAIEQARQVIVILSPHTINSSWVRREIRQALQVQKRHYAAGYRVIPLLLPGIATTALEHWFEEEPLAVPVRLTTTGLSEALPAILAALGERLPDDPQPVHGVAAQPVEDLLLELRDPHIQTTEGKRRVAATATLVYAPADPAVRRVESRRFPFTVPLGPIEADDLRWYLESYYLWPTGVFKARAERIEAQLPQWGQELYHAVVATQSAQEALHAWQHAAVGAERRFSVLVDSDLPDGSSPEAQAAAREAATGLLAIPWELLHDGRSYLFQGQHAVRVRRRLPNRHVQPHAVTDLPIRILLVSPRPENAHTGYIDHRSSSLPLVEAVESLGELAQLTVLTPPTFPALQQALQRASAAQQPFDVVHFDGHGVYDRRHGLGGLCFEDPRDSQKLHEREMAFVDAREMASVVREHRIPLVFLEACQSAQAETDPTASVAAKLLEEGVTSVVAMSHSVLVETARRFVQAFYAALAGGARVGQAMLAGQQALYGDPYRGKIMGAGDLHLRDWFVPVLYQEEHDPQLITALLPQAVRQLQAQQRRLSLGALPEPPPHHFQGRSRELLALERLLHDHPYAVVRGQGGMGKTALAVELARWLVRTGRFRRAAFVSLETVSDVRGVLDSLGRQVLPEGANWSVAQYPDLRQALQPVQRALTDHPTLLVLDNLESVLPDASGQTPAAAAPVAELWCLCQDLLHADPATRLLFTSREALPEPFAHRRADMVLGALSQDDAIALVSQVMAQEGVTPPPSDPGSTPQEITDLVEAVGRHPRALVLLAREVARQGVRATTENLHQMMADLHRKYPDDRENSLYASVQLSLCRLPPEVREQIRVLGVFHAGAHLMVLKRMLRVEAEAVRKLAAALIEAGLAEYMGYDHLRLDPALPPYLLREMSKTEQQEMMSHWAEEMRHLTDFLYQHRFQDTEEAIQLTLLELPNLMALLAWMRDKATPEVVVDLADSVEELLSELGRPQALAQATKVREQAAEALREWSHTRYLTESANIHRMMGHDDLQPALAAAQRLLQHCLESGEQAYPDAAYDIASAHYGLGKVLKHLRVTETALNHLAEAQRRFQMLASAGSAGVERMISAAITEIGDCLMFLERFDEAAAAYEEVIEHLEQSANKRDMAAAKAALGMVRMHQGCFQEALDMCIEALDIFKVLDQPDNVAISWHQIGTIYEQAEQFEQAERAYQQALAIFVQQKNYAGEAGSLFQLGSLYFEMGRLDESVSFFQWAVRIYIEMSHTGHEISARKNLAHIFIELQRYDEARSELDKALKCQESYSYDAKSWEIWDILYDLEQATGNQRAAAQARQQTIEGYLAYRRDGGENQNPDAQLYALVAHAIRQGETTEAEQFLAQAPAAADTPPWLQTLLLKLQAILNGDRDPSLAADPTLNYRDAVELLLLLETLEAG